jgi:hypothetical protein
MVRKRDRSICDDDQRDIHDAERDVPNQRLAQPDDFARAGINVIEDESATIVFVGPAGLAAARDLTTSRSKVKPAAQLTNRKPELFTFTSIGSRPRPGRKR